MAYKSSYNYIYNKSKNSWVFFNTLTGGFAILDDENKNRFDNLPEKNITDNNDFVVQLIKLGFLNEDNFDEKNIVNHSRKRNALNNNVAYLRVLTTTGCNARCPYCYELGFNNKTMSIETSDQLIQYILSLPKLEKFYIHWFGGEPLLNIKVIDNVMENVYKKLEEKGTKVYVYVTSNGSLVNEDIVRKAKKEWHTNWFQITIDDLGQKYNDVKRYVNEEHNFDKVIENIGYLLNNNITVILRINYLPNEIQKVKNVIDYIYDRYEKFCKDKLLIFSPAPIFNTCIKKNIGIKKQKNYRMFEPNKYLINKGLLTFNEAYGLMFKGGQCYACHHGSFVVDPEGNLFKCTVTVNESDACVGSIYDGIDKNEYYYKWVNPKLDEECNKCVFLPICQGGCKAGYLGYMDVCCKRNLKEINEILNYKIDLNINEKNKIADKNEIYLD